METLAQSKGEESTAGINGGSRFRGDQVPTKTLLDTRYAPLLPLTAGPFDLRYSDTGLLGRRGQNWFQYPHYTYFLAIVNQTKKQPRPLCPKFFDKGNLRETERF